MDDWTSSAPDQLAVNEPATNHPRTMTAPLTRPAPSWMTNITPYQLSVASSETGMA